MAPTIVSLGRGAHIQKTEDSVITKPKTRIVDMCKILTTDEANIARIANAVSCSSLLNVEIVKNPQ